MPYQRTRRTKFGSRRNGGPLQDGGVGGLRVMMRRLRSYSQVPNNSNVTFIIFHQKGTPLQAYSGVIFNIFPEFGPLLFLF